MSDLISREALITSLVDEVNTHNDKWFAGIVDAFIREIHKAPTVDAVEVVRCGKCKYFDTDWAYCGSDVHYCKKHKYARRESEFCSDGEV